MSKTIHIMPLWPAENIRLDAPQEPELQRMALASLLHAGYHQSWESSNNSVSLTIDLGEHGCPISSIGFAHSLQKQPLTWRVRGAHTKLDLTTPMFDLCVPECAVGNEAQTIQLPGYLDGTGALDGTGVTQDICPPTTDALSYYYTKYYHTLQNTQNCTTIPALPILHPHVNSAVSYYDSGPLIEDSNNIDCFAQNCNEIGLVVHNIDRVKTPLRFWQIEITAPETYSVLLNKLVIGSGFSPKCNISNGWTLKYVSNANVSRTLGGARKVQCGARWKELSATMEMLTPEEAHHLLELDQKGGITQEYLLQVFPCEVSVTKQYQFLAGLKEFSAQTALAGNRFSKPFIFEEI